MSREVGLGGRERERTMNVRLSKLQMVFQVSELSCFWAGGAMTLSVHLTHTRVVVTQALNLMLQVRMYSSLFLRRSSSGRWKWGFYHFLSHTTSESKGQGRKEQGRLIVYWAASTCTYEWRYWTPVHEWHTNKYYDILHSLCIRGSLLFMLISKTHVEEKTGPMLTYSVTVSYRVVDRQDDCHSGLQVGVVKFLLVCGRVKDCYKGWVGTAWDGVYTAPDLYRRKHVTLD